MDRAQQQIVFQLSPISALAGGKCWASALRTSRMVRPSGPHDHPARAVRQHHMLRSQDSSAFSLADLSPASILRTI